MILAFWFLTLPWMHKPVMEADNVPRHVDSGFVELQMPTTGKYAATPGKMKLLKGAGAPQLVASKRRYTVNVWLNGRKLKEGRYEPPYVGRHNRPGDYWVLSNGLVPSVGIYQEWIRATSILRIEIR